MSSILKALRRLEEERARKSPVAPEIAANLLRGERARRRQPPLWVWPVVTCAAILAALFIFGVQRPQTAGTVVAKQEEILTAPMVQPSIVRPSVRPSEIVIEEMIDMRRPVVIPQPSTPMTVKVPVAETAPPGVREIAVDPPKIVVEKISERQSPVVSAIAWQDENSGRMAVVDGLPVMTGEVVGSAYVQEIQRDAVLFNEGGVLFKVRMQSP